MLYSPHMEAGEFQQMRERMRLTQKELAARLDVTENSIYRWENGKTVIPRTVELAMKQVRRELLEADIKEDQGI